MSCITVDDASQPCIVFLGEKFESVPALSQARSLLLDIFRGEQVGGASRLHGMVWLRFILRCAPWSRDSLVQ
jgi:hypothetical protein